MNNLETLTAELARDGLWISAGLCTETKTVYLISTRAEFWPRFEACEEALDGEDDPLDRYSKRLINAVGERLLAQPVYPSDGPDYPPFIRWALDSKQIHLSPVGLLVHGQLGLWVAFRGALIFDGTHDIPEQPDNPCVTCRAPCLDACPVGALRAGQDYDVPRCRKFVADESSDCGNGCLVRRVCPASLGAARGRKQSRFHMRSFMKSYTS